MTFRIKEHNDDGELVTREVEASGFDAIEKPLGVVSIERIDPDSGEVIEGIYPEDRANERHDEY